MKSDSKSWGLDDLPIEPTFTDNVVQDTYVAELKNVTTTLELKAFLARWESLYNLYTTYTDTPPDPRTKECFDKLLTGDYTEEELAEAIECMEISRNGVCEHSAEYSCMGMHILVPPQLIQANILGHKFEVSTDCALIQMNGGLMAAWEY